MSRSLATALAGAMAVLVGGIVLVGWAFDIVALKSIVPGWVTMKPNASLAFILTGLALLLRPAGSDSPLGSQPSALVSRLAKSCALLAGVIGLLTLSEYIFSWNLGIDQWMFPEAARTVATSNPGRMAPDTALCFVLLSAGVWLSGGPRTTRRTSVAAAILGSLVTVVALAAFLAIFSPVLNTQGWWGLTMMAAHTAAVFAVLGVVIVSESWRDALGSRLSRFSSHLWLMAACAGASVITFVLYARSEDQIALANALRHQSFVLADELRQSGDDLTRMVRTYVITGDPAYKRHYQDILDIRDGRKARPENYWQPYWDLVLGNGPAPRVNQSAVPLLELMRRAGFTEGEFGKLAEAKANSDALTIPEFEAMKLVESTGPDAEANRAKARKMLYDEKYHLAKLSVMRPIHDFLVLVDERTLAGVQAAERSSTVFRYAFVVLGLALFIVLWSAYLALVDTLGGSVDEVHAHIARIGRGDFSAQIQVKAGLENSVLGWLSVKQAELNESDLERKRAEENIRQQNVLLDALINSPSDLVIFSLDRNYCYTAFNDKHRREMLMVWNCDIAVGTCLLECMSDPRLRELARQSIDRGLAGEAFTEIQHQPGPDISYEFVWNPIREEGGGVTGVTAFIRDITERARALDALRASEERFRIAAETANDVVYDWDLEQSVQWVGNVDELLGYEPGAFPRTLDGWAASVHPDDLARTMAQVQAHLEERAPYDAEYRVRRKDGTYRWWAARGAAARTPEGKPLRWIGSITDITERRQADEALRESESRFRQLAESLPQLVWTCQPDGPCDYLNRQWIEFTGVPEARQVGFGWLEQLHPDDRAPTVAAWEAAVAAGTGFHVEFRIRRHDGEYRWFDTQAVQLRDAEGHTVKWFGSNTDITERKRAEVEIRELNAGLEQRVIERTAQLEASNKELEAFSYSVSHDLRAPLRAIDGFGRILVEEYDDRLDAEGRRVLGVISSETRRMGQLVDDLLAFSRLGRQALAPSVLNMTAMAQGAFEEQAALVPARALHLDVKPLLPAHGDRAMIHVVFGNLLSNAIKFTKPRDPAVIEIGSREEDGHVVYYVRDNGVGFDMKYVHNLFGVFQRLHSADEFEGTGVGLALVQRIVHRHGGRVWAEGRVNEGATFCFSLPNME